MARLKGFALLTEKHSAREPHVRGEVTMESIAPTAQVVPPSFCSYSGAVMIERIELPDVQLNSTLTPIECARAPSGERRQPHHRSLYRRAARNRCRNRARKYRVAGSPDTATDHRLTG